jgi:hypothetical protein
MLPVGQEASGSSRRPMMLKGSTGASRTASAAALTTAAGAVACGVCCVLPFGLPAVAAASAVLALAIVWPRIEPYLIDLVRSRP